MAGDQEGGTSGQLHMGRNEPLWHGEGPGVLLWQQTLPTTGCRPLAEGKTGKLSRLQQATQADTAPLGPWEAGPTRQGSQAGAHLPACPLLYRQSH